MTTQTQIPAPTETAHGMTAQEKIQKLQELFAAAPEISTVAETRRLKRAGKALDELLDKVSE